MDWPRSDRPDKQIRGQPEPLLHLQRPFLPRILHNSFVEEIGHTGKIIYPSFCFGAIGKLAKEAHDRAAAVDDDGVIAIRSGDGG
jgi:hypothetical protein